MASASSIIFQQVLTPRIPSIIEQTVVGIAGGVPRSQITTLSELLHVCCLRFREETKATLGIILRREGWPNQKATEVAKRSFEKAILRFVILSRFDSLEN